MSDAFGEFAWGKAAGGAAAELFFAGPDGRLRAVSVTAEPEPRVSEPRDTGIDTTTFRWWDPLPGGGVIAIERSEEALGSDRIHVVLGWASELSRRMREEGK